MQRVGNFSWLNNRATLEIGALVIFTVACILILHQFNQASASSAPGSGNVKAANFTSSSDSSNTSAGAGDASGSASNSSDTSLTVNGQAIPVPQNGAVSQTVGNDGGGTTQVDINNQQTQTGSESGTATNHSSTNISVSSNSSPTEGGN